MGAAENPPTGQKSLAPVLVPVVGVAILVVIMIVIGSAGDSPSATNKVARMASRRTPSCRGRASRCPMDRTAAPTTPT